MRRIFIRVLISLLTFAVGISFTLFLRSTLSSSIRRLNSTVGCGACSEAFDEVIKANFRRRVLLDMRYLVKHPEISDEEFKADGEAHAEADRRVLPQVFPGGYLKSSHSECTERSVQSMAESAAELEWARSQGYFRPRVYLWRTGSFTEPHAHETLYQIDVGECNAQSGTFAYGSTQLVVYSGDELRASVNTLLGGVVYVVPDIDGDGIDEVLMARDEHGPCGPAIKLQLVSLMGGDLHVVHDFGAVGAHYQWDEAGKGFNIEVAVLSYGPRSEGRAPDFRTDIYRGLCRPNKTLTSLPDSDSCWPRAEDWRYVASFCSNDSRPSSK